MSQDPHTYRRAANAALTGLLVQVILALVMTLLGLYAQSPAVHATAWYLLGGVAIWAVLAVLYHQHHLERIEALEEQQLAVGDEQAGVLFEEHADDLRVARQRLAGLYRWGLTGVSLATGGYLICAGAFLVHGRYRVWLEGHLVRDALGDGVSTTAIMLVAGAVAFLSFVVARYESGMTGAPAWGLLRGPAAYLIGNCIAAAVLVVGAMFAHYENKAVMAWLGLVIPGFMLVLGLEVLLALVLGAYRPRRRGQVQHPAFDSRLLGWMTSPGSIAGALGEALNYQFGFEISRSWFYRLLARAVVPLWGLGVVTLIMLSGLVVVAPHEQAVIMRFGRIIHGPLDPGLHVKWPWPIDRAQIYPVGRLHQVLVGSADEPIDPDRAMLWVAGHEDAEAYLITPDTPIEDHDRLADPGNGGGWTGISLVGAQIAVQYRISNLMDHIQVTGQDSAMLTAMAQRRVNAYFATRDIDDLLGPRRAIAGRELWRQIQADVGAARLGVDVVFVGLVNIHPPSEEGVAVAFLEQIGAMQQRQAMIEQANQEANQILALVAGSRTKALQIERVIVDLEDAADPHQQEVEIEQLLTTARGQAAQLIYEARADRWERSVNERAMSERFTAEVLAYRGAPDYYRAKRYLDALAGGLAGARKYILSGQQNQLPVFRIDLKDARSTIDSILQDDH